MREEVGSTLAPLRVVTATNCNVRWITLDRFPDPLVLWALIPYYIDAMLMLITYRSQITDLLSFLVPPFS